MTADGSFADNASMRATPRRKTMGAPTTPAISRSSAAPPTRALVLQEGGRVVEVKEGAGCREGGEEMQNEPEVTKRSKNDEDAECHRYAPIIFSMDVGFPCLNLAN